MILLPQADNEPVKYVEAVTDVLDEPVGRELEDHLDGEDAAEDEVADLHHLHNTTVRPSSNQPQFDLTLVRVSGWSWYSIPMLKVLMKIQRRIPCWKMLWSTMLFKQLLIRPRKELTPFRQAERHLGIFIDLCDRYCCSSYEPHDWLLLCWSDDIEIAVQVVDAFLFLLGIHPLRQVVSGAVFIFGEVKHNS